jgi:uncharacterized membrane protein
MAGLGEVIARRWRHFQMGADDGRTMFPQSTLDALTAAIAAGEATHRGELRLIVEVALPGAAIWARQDIRARALALFAEHQVWDTEDNCGVLLYINLAERKVEIVADRQINRQVAPEQWQAICRTLTAGFARRDFHHATLEAVEQINALLRTHFPATGARRNELPDAPLML